jgi:hypothetical protein
MAFLRPNFVGTAVFMYYGAMDDVSATSVGVMPVDGKPYYLEVYMMDANMTFSETVVTITAGSTVVDEVTVAANTRYTAVDRDGLSSTAVIPGGTALKIGCDDVGTGADLGCIVVMYYVPENL